MHGGLPLSRNSKPICSRSKQERKKYGQTQVYCDLLKYVFYIKYENKSL